ncbi:penicillin acylase family protein [Thalassospiraceae bacterium LMO-SO8]|nr:penicillin acylase family protein [Thalassospiraceae bacterium LMO-SO8]
MRAGENFRPERPAVRLRGLKVWGLALAVALVGGGAALLAPTFAKTSGTLKLAGLPAPVTVTRDSHGVPRIRAGDGDSAFFALGFVHAQDRFFQMELMRRAGAGRLAEMLGAPALDMDRYMRRLGIHRLAEAQAKAASPALKKRLDAYAAGVNAWIKETSWPRTVEFLALRHTPEPWRPADSLVWGKLMALRLAGNWRTERLRLDMLARLSPEQVNFLWPPYPGDAPTAFPGMSGGGSGLAAFPAMDWDPQSVGAPGTASNAWALSGMRTSTGKPFLANDPHLEFQAPILWYLARLETPDGVLAGATVPGVPFLVIGHNGHVAWGFTTTGADTEDLIVETPAEKPGAYRTDADGGTAEFRVRNEVITVRDRAPETLTVLETPDGPVITDAGGRPVTLSAPYLEAGDQTPEALLALNAAKTKADVAAALRRFHAPVQNVLYATRAGEIGMITAGRLPKRKRGGGAVPLVRMQGPVGHDGYLDPAVMPRYADPPGGVLLNANNKVTPPGFPFAIAADWPPPFRARRLADLLAGDRPDPIAPQMDIHSAGAEELLAFALAQLDDVAARRSLVRALERWDGAMDRRQRAPLAFMFFALNLKQAIFADDLGDLIDRWHGLRIQAVVRALTAGQSWCDDRATADRIETCADAVVRALDQTARDLMGLDRELGRTALWGDVHVARFEHPVFRHMPLLRDWTAVEVATDGGNDTLNRGAMWLGRSDAPFAHRHGAGLRALMDLSDLDGSRFVIATGQSGNPLSPRYRDLAAAWRDGQTLTLEAIPSEAGDVLKILPKD